MRRSAHAARPSVQRSSSSPEDAYKEALSQAKTWERPRIREDTLIVATPDALPAAQILYMGCLHAGVKCTLSDPTLASMSILPYREIASIIAFTTQKRSLRVVNLAETASLLGTDVTVVGPKMHPAVEERLESLGVHLITLKDPLLLSMSILATLWIPRLMGTREERVRRELEELSTALEWVKGKIRFPVPIGENSRSPPLYTPMTAPGSYYHCIALRCGIPVPLDAYSFMPHGDILYISGVELHNYKDVMSFRGPPVPTQGVILIDSDPVTVGLYSVVAALLITGIPI